MVQEYVPAAKQAAQDVAAATVDTGKAAADAAPAYAAAAYDSAKETAQVAAKKAGEVAAPAYDAAADYAKVTAAKASVRPHLLRSPCWLWSFLVNLVMVVDASVGGAKRYQDVLIIMCSKTRHVVSSF